MSDMTTPQLRGARVDDVAVIEIMTRDLTGPEMAKALGEQLRSLLQSGETRILLNFAHTRVMSSTAFATVLGFWKAVEAAGGQLRICSMDPNVRFGADIISLGRYIPIHDDEPSALAAFKSAQATD